MFSFFRSMFRANVKHPTTDTYAYNVGETFGPGAQDAVFLQPSTLPVTLYRGAGRIAGSLMVSQHPQVMYFPTSIQTGLGGNVAGQLASQPLIGADGNPTP